MKINYNTKTLEKMGDLFKVLGDLTRLKILTHLSDGELSVQVIAEKLGMSHSAISHQLKTLKITNLVKNRREGKNILYSLSDDHVYSIFTQALEHVNERE